MFIACAVVHACCDDKRGVGLKEDGKLTSRAWCYLVGSLDAVLFVAALAIGIIGAIGLIPGLSPAASYALIGVAGFIALPWVIGGIVSEGELYSSVKESFVLAFSENPKPSD